jgi:choice-of-anchor B domain-containing protein
MKSIILFFLTAFCIQDLAQNNVTFLSNLDQHSSVEYNDIWGYVDGNGIEYALLGCGTGTAIIRVDNPTQPQEVAYIIGPTSSWRDIKTHGTYAYIVTEGTGTGRGLQIVDLSQLPATATLVNTLETWFTRAHNIYVDNGYAYVIGTNNGGGMHILDLSNPTNPTRTAYYTGSQYIHDVYVWNDTVVACAEDTYDLVDVTNKTNPVLISSSQSLPGIYAHSGWMTEDKRYFIACEEFNVRDITVWDLVDRSSWNLVLSSWQIPGASSIVHNLFIKGNYAHISYYTSGYVVLDISDPLNPQLVGQYDTYPSSNGGTYNGAWGCYSYLPSGNTIISDIETGLYVLHFDGNAQTFPLSVSIMDGWNMVSVPGLNTPDQSVNTWWQYRDLAADVFKYDGGYQSETDATPGVGYWMKHSDARIYNTGDEWTADGIQVVPHDPLNAIAGWNLIGGYENIVSTAGLTTTPSGVIDGPVYKYSGGYHIASTLDPGIGYWVKLSGSGQIIIPETFSEVQIGYTEFIKEDWGKIIFTDDAGISYTLYAIKGDVDLTSFELPPNPPSGMFDIRFGSGRIAEDLNSSHQSIIMSGIEYPINVRVVGIDIKIQDETGHKINKHLKSGEEITISDVTINKLMVSKEIMPAQYSLEQNYPNPFNPNTVIEFSLPEYVSNAKLTIYNSLGEEMAELVNTSLQAGKYIYQWDAGNNSNGISTGGGYASGVYFYELRTDNFDSMKKMILIK